MKILAIDSSGLVATVAVTVDGIVVGEYTIHNKKTHSQTLLPMISDMMEMAGLEIEEIDAIAVAAGPGSFTGLRIGASTVKGIAQALDVPVISVPTLEGLAFHYTGASEYICPMMDARRNQTYYGIYDVSGEGVVSVVEQRAESLEEAVEQVNALDKPVVFLGDGVPVFYEQLEELVKIPHRYAENHMRYQKAASVALLGEYYLKQGKQMEARDFSPIYLRVSQAERERLEKNKK